MKTKIIIASVDFTASSNNAANYAAMLAKKLNCQLLLFNMYDIPLIHSNSGLYFMSYTPLREESEKKLEGFSKKLQKLHPGIKIEKFVSTGFFKEQLNSFAKKYQVQVVVMGLSAKDRFSKYIYGSHTTDIAGKIKAPVIIVPDNFKKHHLNKILLGVDNREKLHKSSLKPVESLLTGSKAGLDLLHVKTEDEILADGQKSTLTINGKEHKIEQVTAQAIDKGIGAFSRRKRSDLVAIISKKHSIFYSMFNESNTKKIAFASKVPVMAIHE